MEISKIIYASCYHFGLKIEYSTSFEWNDSIFKNKEILIFQIYVRSNAILTI